MLSQYLFLSLSLNSIGSLFFPWPKTVLLYLGSIKLNKSKKICEQNFKVICKYLQLLYRKILNQKSNFYFFRNSCHRKIRTKNLNFILFARNFYTRGGYKIRNLFHN